MEARVESLRATQMLAEILANSISSGVVISLSGNLGAGKTTFVQAFGRQLGVDEVISSPTFTMMNEYHSGKYPLYHLDFYRIGEQIDKNKKTGGKNDPSLNFFVLEFEEILEQESIVVIEWPEYFLIDGDNYLNGIDRLEININPVNAENAQKTNQFARSLQVLAFGENPEIVLDSLIRSTSESEEIKILN